MFLRPDFEKCFKAVIFNLGPHQVVCGNILGGNDSQRYKSVASSWRTNFTKEFWRKILIFFFFTLKRFCHTHILPKLLFGCEPRKQKFSWAASDGRVLYFLCYEEAQDTSIAVELKRMGLQWKRHRLWSCPSLQDLYFFVFCFQSWDLPYFPVSFYLNYTPKSLTYQNYLNILSLICSYIYFFFLK